MKLHWSTRSPYVRKVMAAAIETGLDAAIQTRLSTVSLSTVNTDVERDNPLGKIPTLVTDDGMALYDSLVICEYLDHHSRKSRLFPRDFEQRLAALRWHALGNGLTDILILWNNERGRDPAHRSAPHLAAFRAKAEATLDALEASMDELERREFDIGHLGVAVGIGHADFRFADLQWRATRPRLSQWADRMAERESLRRTVQFDPRNIPMPARTGKLYLVSLGVGDPDHLTLRADRVMREADLVLGQADAPARYPAQLAGKPFMEAGHGLFTPMARRRAPMDEVEEQEAARSRAIRDCVAAGGTVAILTQGDPTLYGPQIGYLDAFRDLAPEVVPGVSSFAAANAALACAVTGGRGSQSVILSLGKNANEGYGGRDRLSMLAKSRSALVLFTMKTDLARVADELRAGYPGDTPVAIVCHAGRSGGQAVRRATLDTLVDAAGREPLPFEHLIYVGDFLGEA